MRGKEYSVLFNTPDGKELDYNGEMQGVIDFIKGSILEHYKLDMKVTKHMVYNNVHRPESTSKLFRSLVSIQPQ